MYGALLVMVFFIPYSFALIEICQVTMIMAWMVKRFLLGKAPVRRGYAQDTDPVPNSMIGPLIAIGLLIVLTIPFSHDPSLSARKFFSRFLQQVFLMYLVTQVLDSRKRLYGVLSMLLLTFFLVTVDVMIQYTWGKSIVHHNSLIFGRVTGPMNHPNDLGTLLVTVLPVVLASIIISLKRMPWAGGAIGVLFLLLVSALGLTASRGAWVAFAVSMVALGICLKHYKLTVLIILMLAVFSWVYGVHCLSTRVDMYGVTSVTPSNIVKPSFINTSGLPSGFDALEILFGPSGREYYWGTAVNVIKHYPWFGCGYNAYVQTLRDLRVGHEEYPHNSLLHITAELGIVGLLFYLWLFVSLCLEGWKAMRRVAWAEDLHVLGGGLSCGILAWMVHSLMDTPWSSLQLNILLWLLIGILMSLGTYYKEEKRGTTA